MLQLTTPLALREGLGVSPLNSLSPLSLSLGEGWGEVDFFERLVFGFQP